MSQTQRRRRSAGGRSAHTPPALSVDGQFFRNHGERWTGIECSDFSLLRRYLDGENVRPLLAERAGLGFNLLRVWALNQSVVGRRNGSPNGPVLDSGIQPREWPQFYQAVRELTELAGSYGLAIEWTAFTSTRDLMPYTEDQIYHWTSMQDAVSGLGNVLLELVNEWNWGSGENSPDESLWRMRPLNVIASSGSSTADAPPPEPVWDYVLYHSNGLSEWQRRVGHNVMEYADIYQVPGSSNENTRPDSDGYNEIHCEDASEGGALLCAAYCFHSQQGKLSVPLAQTNLGGEVFGSAVPCAQAWVRGARSVPVEFQAGRYIRHEEDKPPDVLRIYERRLADGRGHVIQIRK